MTTSTSQIDTNTLLAPSCSPICKKQLDVISEVSTKITMDVTLVVRRSLGYEDGWAYKESVVVKYLEVFAVNLFRLVSKLGDDSSPLIQQGFQALLSDRDYWMKVEKSAELIVPCEEGAKGNKAISELSKAILHLMRSFMDCPDLISPSSIRLPGQEKAYTYTLAPLYQISTELILECQELMMRYVLASPIPANAILKTHPAVSGLVAAATDKQIREGLQAEGLRYIASKAENCLTALNGCFSRPDKLALLVLLRECDPSILGPNAKAIPATVKSIPIVYDGVKRDLKAVYHISPQMAEQARNIY